MATEHIYKLPSTSYQSNTNLHLMYQHRRHNVRFEGGRAVLQTVTESGKKMEAPRTFGASEISCATNQRQYLYIHLHYSNARRSIVLDAVCKRYSSH
jgi:hypothetical protein